MIDQSEIDGLIEDVVAKRSAELSVALDLVASEPEISASAWLDAFHLKFGTVRPAKSASYGERDLLAIYAAFMAKGGAGKGRDGKFRPHADYNQIEFLKLFSGALIGREIRSLADERQAREKLKSYQRKHPDLTVGR